ncbi:MAG: hypothetical protein DRQ78_05035 [Epsilonproteobacteria bacterium]|nr:MAG: hypothetical protein DRQ78_05035 [Campylobacterota bacterium]
MQYYDDRQNESGIRVIFMIIQMIVLSVVYIFVYTSFLAVGFTVKEYGAGTIFYFPVFVALVIFPILLYKYRQMFNAGNRLVAFVWMMGAASLTVVLLYAYIAQITS